MNWGGVQVVMICSESTMEEDQISRSKDKLINKYRDCCVYQNKVSKPYDIDNLCVQSVLVTLKTSHTDGLDHMLRKIIVNTGHREERPIE